MRKLSQIACLILLVLSPVCVSGWNVAQARPTGSSSQTKGESVEIAPRQIEELPALQADSPVFWVRPRPLVSTAVVGPPTPNTVVNTGVSRTTEGYRIQVYSGRESATARRIFAQIGSITGLEAYLNYEAPQYKVRVGDFVSRDDANLILQNIRRQGFPEAWVVRSMVTVTQ